MSASEIGVATVLMYMYPGNQSLVGATEPNRAMWNSTVSPTDASQMGNPDEDCKTFLFIIYVPVFGTLGLFGLVGNTISFMVLQWEKRARTAAFLLQALCLTDNLFLLTTLSLQVFSSLGLYLDWAVYTETLPYLMVYIWPLIHITQFATVWMTVLVAVNRYIAICLPFQAHKLCTVNKIRIQVLLVSCVAILYNIPRFLEYEIVYRYHERTNQTVIEGRQTAMKNFSYTIIYENVLYCLFVFLSPLLILIILNVRLIRELFRARQRLIKRQIPIPGEEEEQNLTLVMVVIILIFVVCQTPAFINVLLDSTISKREYVCGRPFFYYYHLSNLLVTANSATNFIVYFVFRRSFRERLRAFCRRNRTPMTHTHTDSTDVQGKTMSVYSAEGGKHNGEAL